MAQAKKKSIQPSMDTKKNGKKNGKKKKLEKAGSNIAVERFNSVELGDAVNGVAMDDFGNDKDPNEVGEHTSVGKMCCNIHDFCYLFEFLFKYLSEPIFEFLTCQ